MSPEERFWSKVDKSGGESCWPWKAYRHPKWGYGTFGFGGKMQLAHRVAWILSNGPIPAGLSVLHRCDNPPCCNPAHLFVGTQQQNIADCLSKGRFHDQLGESNNAAKLTERAVIEIRAWLACGESRARIARTYQVAKASINRIAWGLTWKHVA